MELAIIKGQCCDMLSVFTPDSAFQSALLHSSIPNTSKLSTPVIGSYKTWCIPPRNYGPILGNYAIHFGLVFGPVFDTLIAVQARDLGILRAETGTDNIEPMASIAIMFGLFGF